MGGEEFVVETEGHCFLCLEKTSPVPVNLDHSQRKRSKVKESPSLRLHSLQCLARYLGMDLGKVLSQKGEVKMERRSPVLKVELCADCVKLVGRFSKLFRMLEKLNMDVTSCLTMVSDKMMKARKNHKKISGKVKLAHALRKEAVNKCSIKLSRAIGSPTVKIRRLTGKEVNLQLAKLKSSNGRKANQMSQEVEEEESYLKITKVKGGYQHQRLSREVEVDPLEANDSDLDIEASLSQFESEIDQIVKWEREEDSVGEEDDDDDNDVTHPAPDPVDSYFWVPSTPIALLPETSTSAPSALPVVKTTTKQQSKKKKKKRGGGNRAASTSGGRSKSSPSTPRRRGPGKKPKQGPPFFCPICGKEFGWKHGLKGHMSLHDPNRKKTVKCSICSKDFYDDGYLRQHMVSHRERRIPCPVCHKVFKSSYAVNLHLKVHTNLRPFRCPTCGKRFKRRPDLKEHQDIHTGIRRYSCSICGVLFLRNVHLKAHLLTHGGEKKFKCSRCGAAFLKKSNLERHIMRVCQI